MGSKGGDPPHSVPLIHRSNAGTVRKSNSSLSSLSYDPMNDWNPTVSLPDAGKLAHFVESSRPRLVLPPFGWLALERRTASDQKLAALRKQLLSVANRALQEPVPSPLPAGERTLRAARASLERILALSIAARFTSGNEFVHRATEELRAISKLPDWNPRVPIDLAEMAVAAAFGLDWLSDLLDEETCAMLRCALLEKAILPTLDEEKPEQWMIKTSNHNQVAHAGVTAAALAIADSAPQEALFVIRRAITNVSKMHVEYAPDGSYSEGIMYWDYGTSFHGLLSSMLQRAFGCTYGLDSLPGLRESTTWVRQMLAPSGKFFCYGDSLASRFPLAARYWLAHATSQPLLAAEEDKVLFASFQQWEQGGFGQDEEFLRLLALILIWHPGCIHEETTATFPPNWSARGVAPVAVHRSAPQSFPGAYVAIKGGCPQTNHAHLDTGSFIAELGGQRFAEDLGMQHYASLENSGVRLWDHKSGGERWSIFRLGPESHNILCFNEHGPEPGASAEFLPPETQDLSVLDLTKAYSEHVSFFWRAVHLTPSGLDIVIQDVWRSFSEHPLRARWQMLAAASAHVTGTHVELKSEGVRTRLFVDFAPQPFEWRITPVDSLLGPYDEPCPGIVRIELHTSSLPNSLSRLRLLLSMNDQVPQIHHAGLDSIGSP